MLKVPEDKTTTPKHPSKPKEINHRPLTLGYKMNPKETKTTHKRNQQLQKVYQVENRSRKRKNREDIQQLHWKNSGAKKTNFENFKTEEIRYECKDRIDYQRHKAIQQRNLILWWWYKEKLYKNTELYSV